MTERAGAEAQAGAPPPAVDIAIVNWNTGALLRECLASIGDAAVAGIDIASVTVVDNASTDSSAEGLACDAPVEVVRNASNRGFAAACNQGAARGVAPYILFLNPDTRLEPTSLAAPVAWLQAHPDTAITSVQLVDADGRVSRSCSRFPQPRHFYARMFGVEDALSKRGRGVRMTDWAHDETRPVDIVIGAFLLIRRAVFEELGGFDERFFVYFEETDLCLRSARAGGKTVFVAEGRAVHSGQGSTDSVRAARLFYSLRSRILYAFKHYARPDAALLTLLSVTLEPVSRCVMLMARGRFTEVGETLSAYGMWWRDAGNVARTVRQKRAADQAPPGRGPTPVRNKEIA